MQEAFLLVMKQMGACGCALPLPQLTQTSTFSELAQDCVLRRQKRLWIPGSQPEVLLPFPRIRLCLTVNGEMCLCL